MANTAAPKGSNTDEMGTLETIISILNMKEDKRTKADLEKLVPLIKEIKFFKTKKEIKEEDFMDICSCLKYEFIPQDQNVFEFNKYGDKFYILLEGSVRVLIPLNIIKSKKEEEEEEEKERKKKQRAKKRAFYRKRTSSSILARKNSLVDERKKKEEEAEKKKKDEEEKEKEKEKEPQIEFNEVALLKKGASFGELALISNAKRSATIQCVEDCHFAVMRKDDYNKILGRIEQKIIAEKVDFLISLPYFQKWTKHGLFKLIYFFKPAQFAKGEYVYKEGQTPKFIHLIRKGEFQVTSTHREKYKKEIEFAKYLGPFHIRKQREKESMQRVISSNKNKLDSKFIEESHTLQLFFLGAGEITGVKEGVEGVPYSSSLKCTSLIGEVWQIYINDFLRKIKSNEFSWYMIQKHVSHKNQLELKRKKETEIFTDQKSVLPNFDELKSKLKKEDTVEKMVNEIVVRKDGGISKRAKIVSQKPMTVNEMASRKKFNIISPQEKLAKKRNLSTSVSATNKPFKHINSIDESPSINYHQNNDSPENKFHLEEATTPDLYYSPPRHKKGSQSMYSTMKFTLGIQNAISGNNANEGISFYDYKRGYSSFGQSMNFPNKSMVAATFRTADERFYYAKIKMPQFKVGKYAYMQQAYTLKKFSEIDQQNRINYMNRMRRLNQLDQEKVATPTPSLKKYISKKQRIADRNKKLQDLTDQELLENDTYLI